MQGFIFFVKSSSDATFVLASEQDPLIADDFDFRSGASLHQERWRAGRFGRLAADAGRSH